MKRLNAMLMGERVALRPLQSSDVWAVYRWFNDKRVLEDMGSQHNLFCVSMEEEKRAVEKRITSANERSFIIQLREDDKPIGLITLFRMDPRNASTELQVVIGEPELWGKGYGQESTSLVVKYSFDVLNLHRIYLRVAEYNKKAIACFRACGFRKDGTFRDDHFHLGVYMSSVLMSVLRDELKGVER